MISPDHRERPHLSISIFQYFHSTVRGERGEGGGREGGGRKERWEGRREREEEEGGGRVSKNEEGYD